MHEDILYPIIQFVSAGLIGMIACYFIPFVKKLINQDDLDIITIWVKETVYAANQLMKDSTGKEKKEYVVNFLKDLIENKHIKLTNDQLDILIESAVNQIKLDERR